MTFFAALRAPSRPACICPECRHFRIIRDLLDGVDNVKEPRR